MSNSNTAADQPTDSNRRKLLFRRVVAISIVVLFFAMLVVVNLDSVGHRWVQFEPSWVLFRPEMGGRKYAK